jgi:uncharacterized protein YaaR (DUF327 family)
MKIKELNSTIPIVSSVKEFDDKKLKGLKYSSFKENLIEIDRNNCLEQLEKMKEEISKQGQLLSKKADINELKKYRQLVSDFMQEAVKFTFQYGKENGFDGRGRHRIYSVIKNVNKSLDDLTTEILSEQKDYISILDKVDDIRGLLVDMYM